MHIVFVLLIHSVLCSEEPQPLPPQESCNALDDLHDNTAYEVKRNERYRFIEKNTQDGEYVGEAGTAYKGNIEAYKEATLVFEEDGTINGDDLKRRARNAISKAQSDVSFEEVMATWEKGNKQEEPRKAPPRQRVKR
ncbi:MAG: uncharacterized protein A8A55_2288, partial [Amphiamblys sp. WSBS2006]